MTALLVEVPEFAGPLDLLLALIQKRRLDVTAVSLAAVADQYLEQVLALEGELDALSEFLLIASQLLLIKSRALLPANPDVESDADPAEELRRRLAEYQVLRAAAGWLGAREGGGWRSWGRGGELPEGDVPPTLASVTPATLARLLVERLRRRPLPEPKSSLPAVTRPALTARAHYLLDEASESCWLPVERVLGSDIPTAVASFLALLMLVRAGLLHVRQPDLAAMPEIRRVAVASTTCLAGITWE